MYLSVYQWLLLPSSSPTSTRVQTVFSCDSHQTLVLLLQHLLGFVEHLTVRREGGGGGRGGGGREGGGVHCDTIKMLNTSK